MAFFTLALTSCSFSLNSDKTKKDLEDAKKPSTSDVPSNSVEEPKEDFRLVVYYLDQKNVYEGLKAGSTINLNNYIPKVNGYEFKGWYFNKDYSFKYSDEKLSIKLEDYTDVEKHSFEREMIFNRTVYAYAKMLLPGEEDVMPERGWKYNGYHNSVLNIFDAHLESNSGPVFVYTPSQIENSLRYFNFSLDVKKENNVFVGDSNLEATYFFQRVDYTQQLNYSDYENITISQDGKNYTCFSTQPFKYNVFNVYTKEEYERIYCFEPTYAWCETKTIIKNINFSENSNDISIKMNVQIGMYSIINVELRISDNQLTIISSVECNAEGSDYTIDTSLQDRTVIEDFNLNPEFTYGANGEVVGIKINKTYQE